MRRLTAILALLTIGAAPVLAQTDAPARAPENRQSQPDLPPAMQPLDDSAEPQVTIKQREGSTVEEYRINGRLYKIRVIPDRGVPYFLMDLRGDGNFTRVDTPGSPQLSVPMWVIGTF